MSEDLSPEAFREDPGAQERHRERTAKRMAKEMAGPASSTTGQTDIPKAGGKQEVPPIKPNVPLPTGRAQEDRMDVDADSEPPATKERSAR